MRNLDTLFMSLGAILSNKLRSILTLVGIVEQAAILQRELPDVPRIDGPTRMLGPADESKGAE